MKPIRIMSAPVDDGGCGWYRVRQPFTMIRKHTAHDTYIIELSDNMNDVVKAIAYADVMVLRPGAESFMREMHNEPEFQHLKWVMDIDDNTEIISPYSTHYEEYGTMDFFDRNLGKWLWKDGQANFDVKRNRKRLGSFVSSLSEVDMVTVTTPKLAEYARQYNPNVAILPNAIDFSRWWMPSFKKHKGIRIGWSGGISHYEDWHTIKKPLNKLMKQHQFTLVMAGQDFAGIVDVENRHLVETHDWVPFKGHPYRMMMMDLDLAIIPLADLPFNHYKSPIKFLEMSAMGVPSLVANVEPYSRVTADGVTCRTYQSATDFEKTLNTALHDVVAWKKYGKNAYKWVQKEYDAAKLANLWVEAYTTLL